MAPGGSLARRGAVAAVILAYMALAAQYAALTPRWQAPDEPAHYNYVAHVAAEPLEPPVIEQGDYPFAYLERLKAERFPPHLAVAPLTYEDHQPPLYYYAAALAYRLADPDTTDRLRAARWFGVALGAVLVALAYAFVRRGCPGERWVPVAAAAFVAFLPMQLSVTSAVNNDALANVIAAAALCMSLERAENRLRPPVFGVCAGVILGAALLTKVTIYGPVIASLAAAELLSHRGEGGNGRSEAAPTLAASLLIALAIAIPWLARNAGIYGWQDPLAMRAHDAVVVGQPRTAEWLAREGPAGLLSRMAVFTFDSFWGVFGWMGEFLDRRIYQLLAAATAVALIGLVARVARSLRAAPPWPGRPTAALALSAVAIAAVTAQFLLYNATLVQHQGRYFFGAIVPIAFLVCLGLAEAGRLAGAGLAAVAPGPGRGGTWPGRLSALALASFVLFLGFIAWLSLYQYIVPHLGAPGH